MDSNEVNQCKQLCITNVVNEATLKEVQRQTLNTLKDFLAKTYGPMGSYTAIISGSGNDTIKTEYSKDGLKVLKHILFSAPIELSIQAELRDICEYVERKVGDGTTSAVILSALIYSRLLDIQNKYQVPPRKLTQTFWEIVERCKDVIASNKRDLSIENIYDICMISTNGNKEVSNNIMTLYQTYGFDVNIDVDISNDQDSKLKVYDGLTVNQGFSDSAYINNKEKGTAEIHNARVYAFQDPVDSPEMISFMEKIIINNIMIPESSGGDLIPTVIIAPMIGRDGSAILNDLITVMYKYSAQGAYNQKPPIMIVTNLAGSDEAIASDIERLCNCKYIKKFINPDIQKDEQEKGTAPTIDNVSDFYGTCELVVADSEKTKFINPYDLTDNNKENYMSLISFLEATLKKCIDNNESVAKIGMLKNRIRALKANMVQYLVGGISISDREALKDLVEDATKNCASAAKDGYGRAANFEGLCASGAVKEVYESNEDEFKADVANAIYYSYRDAAAILYSTVVPEKDVDNIIETSILNKYPFNVIDLFNSYKGNISDIISGTNVVCSIDTDIEILNAISKIVTMMATANQCLLQTTTLNRY